MKKRLYAVVFIAVLGFGLVYYNFLGKRDTQAALSAIRFPEECLVIDAGHGGEDGGAVSVSGVAESTINLSIALKLEQLFGLYGVSPILLRTEDISLHDDDVTTLREKKVSDLHNRVEHIESLSNVTLISIHQNAYTTSNCTGAQVFFSNPDLSLPFAKTVQETLRLTLDTENRRVAAQIPDSVYLMNHISCRAVLVECGFLSNPQEDLLLQSEEYQTKIAASLLASWLQYDREEQ